MPLKGISIRKVIKQKRPDTDKQYYELSFYDHAREYRVYSIIYTEKEYQDGYIDDVRYVAKLMGEEWVFFTNNVEILRVNKELIDSAPLEI